MPCDQRRMIGVDIGKTDADTLAAAIRAAGGTAETRDTYRTANHQRTKGAEYVSFYLNGVSGVWNAGQLKISAYRGSRQEAEAGAGIVRSALAAHHVQTAAERFDWMSERNGNEITLTRRTY